MRLDYFERFAKYLGSATLRVSGGGGFGFLLVFRWAASLATEHFQKVFLAQSGIVANQLEQGIG